VCFAIPLHAAERVAVALIHDGRVRRARIGVGGQTVPLPRALARFHDLAAGTGVKVLSVEGGEPAEEAGVLRGDVIVRLGDDTVADVDDLQRLLGEPAIGRPVRLTLLRLTEKREVVIVPREVPDHSRGRRAHPSE